MERMYRYDLKDDEIVLKMFFTHRETDSGYWIGDEPPNNSHVKPEIRWVSKTKNRYAFTSKKEALERFVKQQESILEVAIKQMAICYKVLDEINVMELN